MCVNGDCLGDNPISNPTGCECCATGVDVFRASCDLAYVVTITVSLNGTVLNQYSIGSGGETQYRLFVAATPELCFIGTDISVTLAMQTTCKTWSIAYTCD